MDLIVINPNLMRNIRLLRQNILDLSDLRRIQQTILRTKRQTQRLRDGVKISRYGDQAWMGSESCIHAPDRVSLFVFAGPVCLYDGVTAAPW